ncbi:hypothetical protein WR25_25258 isoform C [Diploscapter pachys]|uniref:TATA box-binding protein-like 1 n=1 Tax=Diploscapter pachys TaxID=2018661 RepID=A0A2A2J8K0_9BILA|nr:hypothetical protein WR25_25258 isoform C [Diploscapter pachys]
MRQENILRQCIFLLNEKKKFQFPKGILLIFQIRNIVCNYSLPMHIDLRQLASRSYNVFYDRGKGVLVMQKRSPQCYVKIFSSGKVNIIGCKSEVECKKAARQVARHIQVILERTDRTMKIRNYRVCNLLATCKLPFGIKIEELHRQYPAQTEYEPELMVGMIWKHENPKASLRIHTTGSITIAGASSEIHVQQVLEFIYPIVYEFRCATRSLANRAKKRKSEPQRRNPKRKAASGAYGNVVYFSDEELDEFDDYYGDGSDIEMDPEMDDELEGLDDEDELEDVPKSEI